MKLGIPVIASNVIGLREVVEDKNFLVEEFSCTKTKMLLNKLFLDKNYYENISKNFIKDHLNLLSRVFKEI